MQALCRAAPVVTSRRRPLLTSSSRRTAPVSQGWRDDSPLDDGSDKKQKEKKNKKEKVKTKLKFGSKGKGTAEGATLQTIDLGQGKSVALYAPSDVADLDIAAGSINYATLESFREELYGAGDVIWPASMALARLIAHCPSLVAGKRVLEVGAGLGLVGNVAAQAGAAEVMMVDVDATVLELAERSAAANEESQSFEGEGEGEGEGVGDIIDGDATTATKAKVSTAVLDWKDASSWPKGEYDVVIAADVLYDAAAVPCVAEVVARVMAAGGGGSGAGAMAIISDPENREHRGLFADSAIAVGLETVEADFPGHAGMKLVQATRVELTLR